MKRFIAICLTFVICLSFSSCNISIKALDTLLRPPKLSGESSHLQVAFEKSFEDPKSIVMKNPISGENRSSFLFYDLDSDDIQEAFAFYSDPSISEIAYFSVFKMYNNEWIKVASIKGCGEEIYAIDFADINGDNILEILISWTFLSDDENIQNDSFTTNSDRILTVYNYSNDRVDLLKSEYFTKIFVDDLNNDNSDEILLLNINYSSTDFQTTGRILRFDEEYQVVNDDNFVLSNMINIFNIVTDKVDGHTRIFIDGSISENTLITELVDIRQDDFKITLPLYESNTSDKPSTLRDSQVYCCDVDNDGKVEIPIQESWNNSVFISDDTAESTLLSLTVWLEYGKNKLTIDFKCLYNIFYDYYYVIPNDWIDKVSATYDEDDFSLSFYDIHSNGTDEHIITFKIFSVNDWHSDGGKYTKISESGIFVYAYLFNDNSKYNETNLLKNFVIVN